MEESIFKKNSTPRWGGAISNCHEEEIRINDTLLEKNSAGKNGGAIWSSGSTYELDTCKFEDNKPNDVSYGSIYFKYG
ncbi:hypothetical protein [Methanosphaera sp. BMS]|uniref:hypothetical protein n=1 Tax=Methanosphaera sp. BMS TaxID=1789762 RepID=UPI00374406C4